MAHKKLKISNNESLNDRLGTFARSFGAFLNTVQSLGNSSLSHHRHFDFSAIGRLLYRPMYNFIICYRFEGLSFHFSAYPIWQPDMPTSMFIKLEFILNVYYAFSTISLFFTIIIRRGLTFYEVTPFIPIVLNDVILPQ